MDDLISRQAAIDVCMKDDINTVYDAACLILHLPAAEEPLKWIPVSKKFPEEGLAVLVTIRGHDVIRMNDGETLEQALNRTWREHVRVSAGFFENDCWYCLDGYPMMIQPVAWMALPEQPYEGGII